MNTTIHDVIIVGTGPAGLTAAIYTARAGFEPIIFAGMQHGGSHGKSRVSGTSAGSYRQPVRCASMFVSLVGFRV